MLTNLLGRLVAAFQKIYKFRFFALIFFLILGILIYLTWLVEPSSDVRNILISNTSDHQATISYTTTIPTRGTMMVSANSKFPLLPVFSKDLQKDDGENNTSKTGYYLTHHITVGNLAPSKKYNFRIFQGQKKVFEGTFFTGSTPPSFTSPNPVYGKVVKSDKKTPVVRAIVYFKVVKDASSSALLSTLTNAEGGWSIDLANLRDPNLRNLSVLTKKTQEQIIVEAGNLGRVKAATILGKDKPWPTIIVK